MSKPGLVIWTGFRLLIGRMDRIPRYSLPERVDVFSCYWPISVTYPELTCEPGFRQNMIFATS